VDYIDSHVHVWTDDFEHYSLASGVSVETMELRRFLPNQILGHARLSGVGRIVLIQMSYYGTDNRYMLDVLASSAQVFRGVAVIDPLAKDVPEQMDKLKPLGVRGFRIYLIDQAAAKRLESGAFDRMFQAAAEKGMGLCALINPEFLPALSRICARFSETPVVVDHLGRIGMSGPIEQEQVRALCDLHRHAKVRVKLKVSPILSPPTFRILNHFQNKLMLGITFTGDRIGGEAAPLDGNKKVHHIACSFRQVNQVCAGRDLARRRWGRNAPTSSTSSKLPLEITESVPIRRGATMAPTCRGIPKRDIAQIQLQPTTWPVK
jgi:predicted TIM-barrel fold metal-dependent hydrolase